MSPVVTMSQLLKAGVHFGHQTRRWNPKMQRFIHGERNGIYLIDLNQTLERITDAYSYVRDTVAEGGMVLFVGTKNKPKMLLSPLRKIVDSPMLIKGGSEECSRTLRQWQNELGK